MGLTVLLFGVILGLALNRDFYNDSMASAFLSLALASAVIILAMIRLSWLDLLWVLTGGLFLAVVDLRVLGFYPVFMAGFSFVGMAALAVLGTHYNLGRWGQTQTAALWISSGGSVRRFGVHGEHTARHHGETPSQNIRPVLVLLRLQPAGPVQFSDGTAFLDLAVGSVCLPGNLSGAPIAVGLGVCGATAPAEREGVGGHVGISGHGPLGVLFYNMLPACGPAHIFGAAFPFHPPSIADVMHMNVVPVLLKGARNAIPSLHMAWVLLVWWNSRGLALLDKSDCLAVRGPYSDGDARHGGALLH